MVQRLGVDVSENLQYKKYIKKLGSDFTTLKRFIGGAEKQERSPELWVTVVYNKESVTFWSYAHTTRPLIQPAHLSARLPTVTVRLDIICQIEISL